MNNIKTKLRNALKTSVLDDLMMINSNGPDLEDKDSVSQLLEKACDKWMQLKARNIKKSHRGSRKRGRKILVSDLDSVLSAEHQSGDQGCNTADDTDSDAEDNAAEYDALDVSEAQILKETGIFQPPLGFIVMPKPTLEEFREIEKKSFRNVKIAHKFADEWDVGRWKQKKKSKENAELYLHEVYYSSDKLYYKHHLLLDDYGAENTWCLVMKEGNE